MFNPDTTTASAYMPSLETAAQLLKVVPIIAPVHSDGEIETAIIPLGREPGGGLVVMPDAFMYAHRVPIILAAARNNVPAVYLLSEIVKDGPIRPSESSRPMMNSCALARLAASIAPSIPASGLP